MQSDDDKNTDYWISRWDSMQEYYNPDRTDRFSTLVDILRCQLLEPHYILDIGCGTGSLMELCSKSFPSVHLIGIDMDFTLLHLAQDRLGKTGSRFSLIETDLRDSYWYNNIPSKVNAIISATALHWLGRDELSKVYHEFYDLLIDNGIFLNADHVGSPEHSIQHFWQNQKECSIKKNSFSSESWDSFWNDYLNDFDDEDRERRKRHIGPWKGIEDGLPLSWHFDQLKMAGFHYVDCFYRFFGDAIYGGTKVISKNYYTDN